MTTRKFIENCVAGLYHHEKRVSSVFTDGVNIYSYGYHYPLLVKTSAGYVLNDRGYSNTTAKHISWARAFSIGAVHFYHNSNLTDNGVLASIADEMQQLEDKKNSLSQRAWRQREIILERLADLRYLKEKVLGINNRN